MILIFGLYQMVSTISKKFQYDWWLIFINFIRFSTSATAAEATALKEADDGHAQEEAHDAAKLADELDTILGEVVDALILKRSQEEFQLDCVRLSSLNGLTWSGNLLLNGL